MESGATPGRAGASRQVGDFPQIAGLNPQEQDVGIGARAAQEAPIAS